MTNTDLPPKGSPYPGWISISERMPSDGTKCECLIEGSSHVFRGVFQRRDGWSFAWVDEAGFMIAGITKWRQLNDSHSN